jgi:hypothetical protein
MVCRVPRHSDSTSDVAELVCKQCRRRSMQRKGIEQDIIHVSLQGMHTKWLFICSLDARSLQFAAVPSVHLHVGRRTPRECSNELYRRTILGEIHQGRFGIMCIART